MSDSNAIDPPAGFTGTWIYNAADGGRREWTCVDGQKQGPWRFLLANGTVQREGEMRNGQIHGILLTRGTDGTELDRAEFIDGTGLYRIFSEDDQLAWEIPVVHGERHGTVRRMRRGVWYEEEWRDGAQV